MTMKADDDSMFTMRDRSVPDMCEYKLVMFVLAHIIRSCDEGDRQTESFPLTCHDAVLTKI